MSEDQRKLSILGDKVVSLSGEHSEDTLSHMDDYQIIDHFSVTDKVYFMCLKNGQVVVKSGGSSSFEVVLNQAQNTSSVKLLQVYPKD